jgi:YesN/AraC family two-component response regulator
MEVIDVLVVDDEPGIRSGLVAFSELYGLRIPFLEDDIGFNTIEAASGEEAIEIIKAQPPAIVHSR